MQATYNFFTTKILTQQLNQCPIDDVEECLPCKAPLHLYLAGMMRWTVLFEVLPALAGISRSAARKEKTKRRTKYAFRRCMTPEI